MPREYTRVAIHPTSQRVDPDRSYCRCEAPGCQNEVLLGKGYSIKAMVATTGPHGDVIGAFQCVELHHFGCSPEHARAAVIACIDNDLMPRWLAAEAALLESVK